jgi:hypothetical protein
MWRTAYRGIRARTAFTNYEVRTTYVDNYQVALGPGPWALSSTAWLRYPYLVSGKLRWGPSLRMVSLENFQGDGG